MLNSVVKEVHYSEASLISLNKYREGLICVFKPWLLLRVVSYRSRMVDLEINKSWERNFFLPVCIKRSEKAVDGSRSIAVYCSNFQVRVNLW